MINVTNRCITDNTVLFSQVFIIDELNLNAQNRSDKLKERVRFSIAIVYLNFLCLAGENISKRIKFYEYSR